MTTSLPSSPEPSSRTRVACGLFRGPIETGLMRGSYPAPLSLDRRGDRPIRADVVGAHVLAWHPKRRRARIHPRVKPVLRNRADPDLLALLDAVRDACRRGVRARQPMAVVALAREHDPV